LNGTDQYAYRNITCLRAGAFDTNNELNIEIEFTPDFAFDENSTRYLFSAGTDYYLVKLNNAGSNVLRLYLGGTAIVDVASATYSSYWNVGAKNNITIASRGTATAATDIYLNGTLIVNADNSAWARTTQTTLNIGADSSGNNVFDGNIHSIKIGTRKFSASEVSKIVTKTSLSMPFILECPMTTALHDAANTRSLDVSGSGNHLIFGAGAATPTKLTTVGYSTDGGDYLRTANNPITPTTLTMACFFRIPNASATQSVFDYTDSTNTANRGGSIFYSTGGLLRFYVGGAAAGNAAVRTLTQSYEGGLYFVVGCYDGTNVSIWVNGIKGTNAATPIPPVSNANSKFAIFARANGTTSPCAAGVQVYYASAGAFVITETQVRHLTNKITNMLNLI